MSNNGVGHTELKSYKGYGIRKYWNIRNDGKIDTSSIVYKAFNKELYECRAEGKTLAEVKHILDSKWLRWNTHEFQLVDTVPKGYLVWSIDMKDGYLPLCKLLSIQPFEGACCVDTSCLKAIKMKGAKLIVNVATRGMNTLEKMDMFIEKKKNVPKGSNDYQRLKMVKEAREYLASVTHY